MSSSFPAFVVRQAGDGTVTASVEALTVHDLPDGDVLIRVACSSLNYKDAMACEGHPGVVGSFPHVPGIDCAGVVEQSSVDAFVPGDEVIVTGYGLGAGRWGGYAAYVRVPGTWVVPLPAGLSLEDAMTYGTAGFTAAQSVAAIVERRTDPDRGEVIVTGATGGVGTFAVAILSKLGYRVVASTGKPHAHDYLHRLGAARTIAREDLTDTSDQPLLRSRWAAAVDTVGGDTLETILRSTKHRACVAACGLVGGVDLKTTVYPFILRGVNLAGIDSAKCPMNRRLEMWRRLSEEWKVVDIDGLAKTIALDKLPDAVAQILAGAIEGRTLVRPMVS